MAQISYWKQVNKLLDTYEYHKIHSIHINSAEELLQTSITDFIETYQFHKSYDEIHKELYAILDSTKNSIEEAMVRLGQKWYEEE
jgi:hypothetical protein